MSIAFFGRNKKGNVLETTDEINDVEIANGSSTGNAMGSDVAPINNVDRPHDHAQRRLSHYVNEDDERQGIHWTLKVILLYCAGFAYVNFAGEPDSSTWPVAANLVIALTGIPIFMWYVYLFADFKMAKLVLKSHKFWEILFVVVTLNTVSSTYRARPDQKIQTIIGQFLIFIACLSPFFLDMCTSSHREVEFMALVILANTCFGMFMTLFVLEDVPIFQADLGKIDDGKEVTSMSVSRSSVLFNCYSTLLFLYLDYFHKALVDSHNRNMFFVTASVKRPSTAEGAEAVYAKLQNRRSRARNAIHF